VAIFFDKGRDPHRKLLLPEYKANRCEVPDPVKIQIPVVKEFAYALGCTVIERSAIEADDLIASFAQKYQSQFDEIVIFSADKDFAQCIEKNIYQIVPESHKTSLGRRLDRMGIFEKFGVYPEQMVDYLALIGDQADNIPGIRGVGPKTASAWLKQFGTTETLLSQIPRIKPLRFQSLLRESIVLLHRNQRLIALNRNIDDIYCEILNPNERQYEQLIDFYKLTALSKSPSKFKIFQPDFFNDLG
jgi:DNA polymerase-1